MKLLDLTNKKAEEVRNDTRLFSFYLEQYRLLFGYEPNCAPCTFLSDWNKFCNLAKNKKQLKPIVMKEKTFKLKDVDIIYRYLNKAKNTKRSFGYNMTEEFAEEYLTTGTQAERAERKKQFIELPISLRPKEKKVKKPITPKNEVKSDKDLE